MGGCLPSSKIAAQAGHGPAPQPKASIKTNTERAQVLTPLTTTRVTKRPANRKGGVFILEYHHIKNGRGPLFRSVEGFRNDLNRLYKLGFRPVTVQQYLDDKMPLPPGASPVILTFDDSNPSQVVFKKDGSLDPNSGLGVMVAFAKLHPDFPARGMFFVLPDVMWSQEKFVAKKLALLHKLGCEIGSHTVTHPFLRHLSDDGVKREIGGAHVFLTKIGEKPPFTLAYPYGSTPHNNTIVKGFEWKGMHVKVAAAFLAGANPALPACSNSLNRYKIPRIQPVPGPYGLNFWLQKVAKGSVKPYVAP